MGSCFSSSDPHASPPKSALPRSTAGAACLVGRALPEVLQRDVELMSRCCDSERAALRLLARRLMPRAQKVCCGLLRDRCDAQDASQAALLQVFKSVGSYRGECPIENWADRIVVRAAVRWATSERSYRNRTVILDDFCPEPVAPSEMPLGEYLTLLPHPQRVVLLLRCYGEHSVDEIAGLLRVSPNTVKDRLKRARQTLRSLMSAEAENAAQYTVQ